MRRLTAHLIAAGLISAVVLLGPLLDSSPQPSPDPLIAGALLLWCEWCLGSAIYCRLTRP